MKLYLISYPHFFADEVKSVALLMEQYDFTFHLRKPHAQDFEYENYLKHLPLQYHSRVVLHSAWHLQNQFNVKGVHFPSYDRGETKKYPKHGTQSTSCHSLQEIKQHDGEFNYMFLSPIFNSISKKGYKSTFNIIEVQQHLKNVRHSDIIALGGISALTYPMLDNCMFDGLAVLGAVWTLNPSKKINFTQNLKSIYQCIHPDYIA
jgi:thiamine-phosphate pyrophosphorylase